MNSVFSIHFIITTIAIVANKTTIAQQFKIALLVWPPHHIIKPHLITAAIYSSLTPSHPHQTCLSAYKQDSRLTWFMLVVFPYNSNLLKSFWILILSSFMIHCSQLYLQILHYYPSIHPTSLILGKEFSAILCESPSWPSQECCCKQEGTIITLL